MRTRTRAHLYEAVASAHPAQQAHKVGVVGGAHDTGKVLEAQADGRCPGSSGPGPCAPMTAPLADVQRAVTPMVVQQRRRRLAVPSQHLLPAAARTRLCLCLRSLAVRSLSRRRSVRLCGIRETRHARATPRGTPTHPTRDHTTRHETRLEEELGQETRPPPTLVPSTQRPHARL